MHGRSKHRQRWRPISSSLPMCRRYATCSASRIVAASAVMQNNDQIVVNGKVREVTINGVDDQYAQVRNLVILHGRAFDQSDMTLRERVAMLTDKLAVRIFGSQEAALGQTIKISQLQFTVIGTFREKTSTFGTGRDHG